MRAAAPLLSGPLVAALALTSCAHFRARPADGFFCRAPVPSPAPPLPQGTPLASGKLEVKATGTAGELRERHLSLSAEGVPLSLLGPRLGAALGAPVVVESRALDFVVSLHADDVTLARLGFILSRSVPVNLTIDDGVIRLESQAASDERRLAMEPPAPVALQLYPLKHRERARALAAFICGGVLSTRGYVSVVGSDLLVSDVVEAQGKVAASLAQLDQ